ncbi:ATP-binding protein [bacterium]|nr:ATP-binding protein [bacterium]
MQKTSPPKSRKLVLTGGPCGGKSTIAEVLGRSFNDKIVVVPESASALFRSGFPRFEEAEATHAFQTAVYQVQIAVERAFEAHHGARFFVLDRGSIDGAAYWPDGPEKFFQAQGTTVEAELARYDRVIYLESAEEKDYEEHRAQNPVRSEGYMVARKLDAATRALWTRHPNCTVVRSQASFSDKVQAVVKLLEKELSA